MCPIKHKFSKEQIRFVLINIINNNIDILMISEKKLASFTFMAFLNLIGLIEIVAVVEYFCIFVRIYLQN